MIRREEDIFLLMLKEIVSFFKYLVASFCLALLLVEVWVVLCRRVLFVPLSFQKGQDSTRWTNQQFVVRRAGAFGMRPSTG